MDFEILLGVAVAARLGDHAENVRRAAFDALPKLAEKGDARAIAAKLVEIQTP